MQRFLLLLVAFLAGAILMGLELAGSRLLAPYFGGSIFVWGSLIGVFLAALSIGYYVGGRLVDRWPGPGLLSALLLAAGLLVLLMPRCGPAVCDRISMGDFGARAGPLLACMMLFFLPAGLMAVTSPFVIRLGARSIEQVGSTSGSVYAVSTIGSIAGTLGTAFYLIPGIGTRAILYLLGALLILSALIAAAGCKLRRTGAAGLAIFMLLTGSGPACARERVLLERDSPYHRLLVTEDDNYRWLRADNWVHTRMRLRDPHGRGLAYTDYVDIAFLFNPDIETVLAIGLGGGTIPKRFVRDYPRVKVDAVEIDPDVIKIAARYFDVHAGPRLAIHQSDGRMFLRRSRKTWDLIFLDAYYADTAPFFLATREFFKIARDHLNPGGVIVNNVIGATKGPRSRFFRSVYRTMKETFPQVHAFQVPGGWSGLTNIEVIAVNSQNRITLETLRARAAQMQGNVIKDEELVARLRNYVGEPVRTDDVPTLTDDYAPVDGLIHFR